MKRHWAVSLGLCALCLVPAASAASGQVKDWPLEREPRPLPAREVKFPPYEVRTLANGMQVIAVLHHEQPVVSMRLLVRAGSVQDPAGKVGVASLTAALLDQGTTTKSAAQIADQIDFIGGALGTGSTPDLSFVNAVVMKDSFGVGLELIADLARNPSFAPEEIDRQKQQTISALQVNLEDPDYVANVLFDRLVYGFHPYGLPNNGTPETIASITREDLQAYHRRYFVANNMILAIVGDVSGEEAFAGAERVFGRWPRVEVVNEKIIEPPPPARRIVIIDKPDSVQTEIRVGQVAIPRRHPDYMAWDLAVKILGGEGANRLHRVLRSERGLTYGASADTEARKQAGDYVAETDTRTDTTGEALRLMIDEFAKLPRDRVFERELSDAQAYLSGSFPLTIETPNDIATQVLNVVFYDLPVEEIGTFPRRVQAVTPDDIQRVARQYIRTDRLSIVLVGNAAAFVPQLKQVGFSEFEVIPIGQLSLLSSTLKKEAGPVAGRQGPPRMEGKGPPRMEGQGRLRMEGQRPLRMEAGVDAARAFTARESAYQAPAAQSAHTDARATDLLARVVEARGGLDALKKVRTVVADADTTFQMEQGPLSSSTKTYVAYPDRFRVDATVGAAQVVQVFNAGMAWVKDPSGVHEAPPGMRDDFAASVRRDTIPMLIAAAEGRLTARLLADEGRDGRTYRVLEISGAQLSPVKLYIDPQYLIARQSFAAAGPDGRPVQAEEAFSDYRLVSGVQVPFKAEVYRGGRVILSRVLKNVVLNTALADTLFARPQ